MAARRNGVEVEEFGFGFPPRATGRQFGRTLYSLNWLPLGGFVRLTGEDGADTGPGTFGGASIWIKTKILLAGVCMNAITAYAILFFLCARGLPVVFTADFKLPAPAATSTKQVVIVDIVKDSPAEKIGIQKGDVIASGDGQAIKSEEELHSFTQSHAGKSVQFVIKHGSQERTASTQLSTNTEAKDGGYLGVTTLATQEYSYGWKSPLVAASLFTQLTWGTLIGFGNLAVSIPSLVGHTITHKAVDTAATGPVGIFAILNGISFLGTNYLLFFVANISVALFVINSLPVPALDGGRLFLIITQRVFKKQIPPDVEAKIHTYGFLALIFLMLLISINDVKRFH